MAVPNLHGVFERGAAGADELLVLGPTLGTATRLWDGVLARARQAGLTASVLRFDPPGHGASDPASGPFTIAEFADAVLELVDAHGGGSFHYVGISMTGTVGVELGVRHSDRLRSLGLIATGARIGDAATWDERAELVRTAGTAAVVDGTRDRWFTAATLAEHPVEVAAALADVAATDDESYALCLEALRDFDRTADLASITAWTWTVSGSADSGTTPESMAAMAAAIPDARSYELPGAHQLPVSHPEELARLLVAAVNR